MKLAIIGSRNFDDYPRLCATMDRYFGKGQEPKVTEIISGGARGADSLGACWARDNQVKLTEFLPDWEKYGKAAGFIRNEEIIKNSNVVLAFWDSKSKGTGNSLAIAKRLGRTTLIVYF